MLEKMVAEGVIPFRYVAADSIYGNSPEFLDAVEKIPGVTYLVSIPKDTLCWLHETATIEKFYRYGGQKRTKNIHLEAEKKPVTFEKIAKGMNDYFWYRRTVSEGAKGPITYEFMKRRVVLAKDGEPYRTVVWLIVRRNPEDKTNLSYFISNAGRSTRLKTFVWLSGIRWAIEQCFEEKVSRMAASYADHHAGSFFPLAHENQIGGKKRHLLRCRSLGCSSASHCL